MKNTTYKPGTLIWDSTDKEFGVVLRLKPVKHASYQVYETCWTVSDGVLEVAQIDLEKIDRFIVCD